MSNCRTLDDENANAIENSHDGVLMLKRLEIHFTSLHVHGSGHGRTFPTLIPEPC